jgi:hypothetical protein
MTFSNRKNILSEAKETIHQELNEKLCFLVENRNRLQQTIDTCENEGSEDSKEIIESLNKLNSQIESAAKNLTDWQSSKRIKKKKQIEWKSEKARDTTRNSRPKKEINWDAADKVRVKNKSLTKNNRSWLDEGSLVVHKDNRDHFLMVITINDNGSTTLLDDGVVRHVRTLALRPALDE